MTTTPTPSKSRSKATAGRRKSAAQPTPANTMEHIAVAAYYKAQARGFTPGGELDDWLQAESEFGHQTGAA